MQFFIIVEWNGSLLGYEKMVKKYYGCGVRTMLMIIWQTCWGPQKGRMKNKQKVKELNWCPYKTVQQDN